MLLNWTWSHVSFHGKKENKSTFRLRLTNPVPQFCFLGKSYCHIKTLMIFMQKTWNNESKTKRDWNWSNRKMKDSCLHRKYPGYKIITKKNLITPQDFPVTQTVDHAGGNTNLVWSVHYVLKCVFSAMEVTLDVTSAKSAKK